MIFVQCPTKVIRQKIRFVNGNEMRSQTNAYVDNTTTTSDETIDLVESWHFVSIYNTKN